MASYCDISHFYHNLRRGNDKPYEKYISISEQIYFHFRTTNSITGKKKVYIYMYRFRQSNHHWFRYWLGGDAGMLLIRTLGTIFSEILGEIHSFSFSKMYLKMSSAKWRLFDLGLNELSPHGFWAQIMAAYIFCICNIWIPHTVYPKKYAHGFVVLCFVGVMQSFIMNSHEVFIHIHQGCFAGTGATVRLPQCQWSKPDGYGKISQCITTTKHSKAKTMCIFLGIYCIPSMYYMGDSKCITSSVICVYHHRDS